MNDATAPAVRSRRVLDGRVELFAAVLQTIGAAQRLLCAADLDLAAFGLASRAHVEALQAFVLTQPGARVRLLVDSADWLERDAMRLRALQQRLPEALELRLTAAEDPIGDDSFLLADDRHLLRRNRSSAILTLHDPAAARATAATFERRWQAAAYNLPVRPLGL
jgi:hypothetical protein